MKWIYVVVIWTMVNVNCPTGLIKCHETHKKAKVLCMNYYCNRTTALESISERNANMRNDPNMSILGFDSVSLDSVRVKKKVVDSINNIIRNQ